MAYLIIQKVWLGVDGERGFLSLGSDAARAERVVFHPRAALLLTTQRLVNFDLSHRAMWTYSRKRSGMNESRVVSSTSHNRHRSDRGVDRQLHFGI